MAQESSLTRRKISRRRALQIMGGLAGVAALAACAPAGAPQAGAEAGAAPSAEGKVIQHWVFWSQPERIKETLLATESLKAAIGDSTLDFKTGVGPEPTLAAVAAGTPPDIGVLNYYTDFMVKKAVIPLDDYISASSVISQDNFIPGNWEVVQLDGVVYGIPAWECFVRRGLNYNTRLVEEAGLDPDNPPLTWEELFVWHEALTKFDDAGNLLQLGLDPYDAEGGVGPGNDGWMLTESWGFDYFDEEARTFNLDNELMAQGLDTMGEFVKLIGPDNLVGMRAVQGQGEWGGSYNAEVQAMIIEGYWHPGETANEKPEVSAVNRATWAPVPASRAGTQIQFGGGHMAQIFKDAKFQDEAWPVAEWLQSNEFCDIVFNDIGWLPAYKPYFDHADPSTYPGLDFYFQSVNDANSWGKFIRCEIEEFIITKFVEVRDAVNRGNMTGAEAAATLQEAAETEWKNAGYG